MKQSIKIENNKDKLNPLPIEFFENLKSVENKNTDSDDIEPFEFSKEVLNGDKLITVVGIEKIKKGRYHKSFYTIIKYVLIFMTIIVGISIVIMNFIDNYSIEYLFEQK